ncbi:hypothetical protein VNI00_007747 [Paramarasmius palmivorus]|uniref:Uncharacterized protein n=1 Tax=Paramarasmius palmivorus TaxID=297713 RepID=A0AAW0D277_9AGAR
MAPSSKTQQLFDNLPLEAQRELIDTELWGLLASVNPTHAEKLENTKKKEIKPMLADLRRDSKRSVIKERLNRDGILEEILESLTEWLSEIWQVMYEHKAYFEQAHACLMYVWDVFDELKSYPIHASIKSRKGKTIKKFPNANLRNSDGILLWLWRELLVSLSAARGPRAKTQIESILFDIEDALGAPALERLLYGGRRATLDFFGLDLLDEDPFDTDDEDEYEDEDEDDEEEDGGKESDWVDTDDDESIAAEHHCRCRWHASHWSPTINYQRIYIRDAVLERLRSLFETSPSVSLHRTIMAISPDTATTTRQLSESLARVASHSSSNVAAALVIYSTVGDLNDIITILDNYSHLIRPRDASSYQCAVIALCDDPKNHLRVLKILQAELQETIGAMHAAIKSCFSKIDEQERKTELQRILKLQFGSQQRKERVENWVDSVMTPFAAPMNPMTFMGLVMGLSSGYVEDEEENDILAFLDTMESDDEETEDLRDEYQPRLKERFQGWIDVAQGIKFCPNFVQRHYAQLVEQMPFLRGKDVVEEMICRFRDRPAKAHVAEALESLSSFAKLQRQKNALRKRKREQREKEKQQEDTKAQAQKKTGVDTDKVTATQPVQPNGPTARPPPPPLLSPPPSASGLGSSPFTFSFGPSRATPQPGPGPIRTQGGLDDVD